MKILGWCWFFYGLVGRLVGGPLMGAVRFRQDLRLPDVLYWRLGLLVRKPMDIVLRCGGLFLDNGFGVFGAWGSVIFGQVDRLTGAFNLLL